MNSKERFLRMIENTEEASIVMRVKERLKDNTLGEEKWYAVLDEARSMYQKQKVGPVSGSVMRFQSRSYF